MVNSSRFIFTFRFIFQYNRMQILLIEYRKHAGNYIKFNEDKNQENWVFYAFSSSN